MWRVALFALALTVCQGLDQEHHIVKRDAANFPTQGTDNIVELGVWIAPDLEAYLQTLSGKNGSALDNYMTNYATSLFRDVDIVFRGISFGFRVYVSWVQTAPGSQNWYNNNINSGKLDGTAALSAFASFIDTRIINRNLPPVDHVIALTRSDIEESVGTNPEIISIADVDSMCSGSSSNSIAEVSTPYYMKAIGQAILLASGVTYISGGNLFLMSTDLTTIPPSSQADQPWRVKAGKQNQLASYISGLGSNCLLTEDASYDYTTFARVGFMGLEFSLNQQCALVYDPASVHCSSRNSTICYEGVVCTDPSNSDSCDLQLYVGDRTKCGSGFSCDTGTCDFPELTSSTSSSTFSPTQTTERISTDTPLTSPGPGQCEEEPVGRILIDLTYIPCPDRR